MKVDFNDFIGRVIDIKMTNGDTYNDVRVEEVQFITSQHIDLLVYDLKDRTRHLVSTKDIRYFWPRKDERIGLLWRLYQKRNTYFKIADTKRIKPSQVEGYEDINREIQVIESEGVRIDNYSAVRAEARIYLQSVEISAVKEVYSKEINKPTQAQLSSESKTDYVPLEELIEMYDWIPKSLRHLWYYGRRTLPEIRAHFVRFSTDQGEEMTRKILQTLDNQSNVMKKIEELGQKGKFWGVYEYRSQPQTRFEKMYTKLITWLLMR